jgi:hypothetical protein
MEAVLNNQKDNEHAALGIESTVEIHVKEKH